MPDEFALVHVSIDDLDGDHDAVVEQQPVGLALERGLGDESDQADVVDIHMDPRFFHDLALGALGGGFTEVHFKLAPDRGAEALVGRFDPVEEQDAPVLVAQIAQARELVRQRTVRRVLGHSGQDIGGITHELR